jgi:hypothetical protein
MGAALQDAADGIRERRPTCRPIQDVGGPQLHRGHSQRDITTAADHHRMFWRGLAEPIEDHGAPHRAHRIQDYAAGLQPRRSGYERLV